jgi:hypothetical protein
MRSNRRSSEIRKIIDSTQDMYGGGAGINPYVILLGIQIIPLAAYARAKKSSAVIAREIVFDRNTVGHNRICCLEDNTIRKLSRAVTSVTRM